MADKDIKQSPTDGIVWERPLAERVAEGVAIAAKDKLESAGKRMGKEEREKNTKQKLDIFKERLYKDPTFRKQISERLGLDIEGMERRMEDDMRPFDPAMYIYEEFAPRLREYIKGTEGKALGLLDDPFSSTDWDAQSIYKHMMKPAGGAAPTATGDGDGTVLTKVGIQDGMSNVEMEEEEFGTYPTMESNWGELRKLRPTSSEEESDWAFKDYRYGDHNARDIAAEGSFKTYGRDAEGNVRTIPNMNLTESPAQTVAMQNLMNLHNPKGLLEADDWAFDEAKDRQLEQEELAALTGGSVDQLGRITEGVVEGEPGWLDKHSGSLGLGLSGLSMLMKLFEGKNKRQEFAERQMNYKSPYKKVPFSREGMPEFAQGGVVGGQTKEDYNRRGKLWDKRQTPEMQEWLNFLNRSGTKPTVVPGPKSKSTLEMQKDRSMYDIGPPYYLPQGESQLDMEEQKGLGALLREAIVNSIDDPNREGKNSFVPSMLKAYDELNKFKAETLPAVASSTGRSLSTDHIPPRNLTLSDMRQPAVDHAAVWNRNTQDETEQKLKALYEMSGGGSSDPVLMEGIRQTEGDLRDMQYWAEEDPSAPFGPSRSGMAEGLAMGWGPELLDLPPEMPHWLVEAEAPRGSEDVTGFAQGGVVGQPYIGGPTDGLVGEAGLEWVGNERNAPIRGQALLDLINVDNPMAQFSNGGYAQNDIPAMATGGYIYPQNKEEMRLHRGNNIRPEGWMPPSNLTADPDKRVNPQYTVNPWANTPGYRDTLGGAEDISEFGPSPHMAGTVPEGLYRDVGAGGAGEGDRPTNQYDFPLTGESSSGSTGTTGGDGDGGSGTRLAKINPRRSLQFREHHETLREMLGASGKTPWETSGGMTYGRGMAPLVMQSQWQDFEQDMRDRGMTFDQIMAMNRFRENQNQFAATSDLQAQMIGSNASAQYNPYGLSDFVGQAGQGLLTYDAYSRRYG